MKRFIEKEDYYLDTKTGLEWEKQNRGKMTWHKAMEIKDGWRLPTIEELLSIISYPKYSPATELFDMIASYYWSSTTYAYGTDYAWYVGFHDGTVADGYKSDGYYVRCVR